MKEIVALSIVSVLFFPNLLSIVKPTEASVSLPEIKKEVALTFDADMTVGMLNELKTGKVKSFYNKAVTDILEREHVTATIFITGLWANEYPDIVKSFVADGYEIGNHSYDHSAFTEPCYKLPPAKDKVFEIEKTQEILKGITGKKPELFRFPGGCHSENDVSLVKANGLSVTGWDVLSGDSFLSDPKEISRRVLGPVKDGSVVVMHISGGHAFATAPALDLIISELKKEGYSFVTVSEILSRESKKHE